MWIEDHILMFEYNKRAKRMYFKQDQREHAFMWVRIRERIVVRR